MKIREITCTTALVKSGLPSDDFVINPYSGCAFGCAYCYAEFTRRFQGHLQDAWGEYADARMNIAEVLDKEVRSLKRKMSRTEMQWKNGKYPMVLMSSVTDPYQGIETKYQLTRKCIEVLIKNDFPGELSMLTKSPLVMRDIDLFKQLKRVSVGITITSTDDSVSRLLEKNAPTASSRLKALKKLNDEGISTYVCVNPLLPHFVALPDKLEELFRAIKDAGTNEIFIEHLNLSGNKKRRLYEQIKDKLPEDVIEEFWFSQTDDYKRQLEELIYSILDKIKLRVLAGGIIDHEKLMGKGIKFTFK